MDTICARSERDRCRGTAWSRLRPFPCGAKQRDVDRGGQDGGVRTTWPACGRGTVAGAGLGRAGFRSRHGLRRPDGTGFPAFRPAAAAYEARPRARRRLCCRAPMGVQSGQADTRVERTVVDDWHVTSRAAFMVRPPRGGGGVDGPGLGIRTIGAVAVLGDVARAFRASRARTSIADQAGLSGTECSVSGSPSCAWPRRRPAPFPASPIRVSAAKGARGQRRGGSPLYGPAPSSPGYWWSWSSSPSAVPSRATNAEARCARWRNTGSSDA